MLTALSGKYKYSKCRQATRMLLSHAMTIQSKFTAISILARALVCHKGMSKLIRQAKHSAVIWQKGVSHDFTISKISRKTTLKFETKKAIELYLYIAQ